MFGKVSRKSGDTVNRVFKNFLGSTLPGREIIYSSRFGEHESYRARVDIVPADLDLDDTEIETDLLPSR